MGRVAIVGGGIGGLTLAGLLSGEGWSVDVFERSAGLPDMGSALGMWPDAMAVLSQLGIADDVRRTGHPQGSAEIRDFAGRLLSQIPARGETVMISRVALLEALYSAVGPATTVHFGSEIENTVGLDHDVIVGADGVNSRVRRSVAGSETEARALGVSVVIGQFDGTTDMFTEYWGPGKSFGITPLSADRCDWHAAYRSPAPGTAAAEREEADPLAFVVDAYSSWADPVPPTIGRTIGETVLRYHVRTTPRQRHWYRGNTVLIGDAVHAMAPNLGRGACETILDAAALARVLGVSDDVASAFQRYRRDRRSSAYRIAAASRVMCRLGMLDGGAALRNLAMAPMRQRGQRR
ncbi:putative oxidoreductase [Gordonia araii NBRC 100433]|uniref:Putative oxidoreductase n=1 Tax=Gordonia araii NBRC 100433 TaxID=1073574 RepID=G7H5U2_9ACTN|nr:FAD-dependent monooxygenase [Gordonia araii]NNG95707.1 NAD(P)-binding protein [Gordonia araii NBRC 100433]GAB11217.1 putative oxidoreductase [Gordonia araii NBRC 100433]